MSAAPFIDLSAIPESQRAAVLAVLPERDALRETNRRLEHLIAELNQVVHGKRSEKLSDDERQLASRICKRPSPRRRHDRTPRHRPARLRVEPRAAIVDFFRQSCPASNG